VLGDVWVSVDGSWRKEGLTTPNAFGRHSTRACVLFRMWELLLVQWKALGAKAVVIGR
jgi:Na+-transporting NADH:ubiquinone oxidoreductase subunit NqrB